HVIPHTSRQAAWDRPTELHAIAVAQAVRGEIHLVRAGVHSDSALDIAWAGAVLGQIAGLDARSERAVAAHFGLIVLLKEPNGGALVIGPIEPAILVHVL